MNRLLSIGILCIFLLAAGCKNSDIGSFRIGEPTENERGKTAENLEYGLILQVKEIKDYRCPIGLMCAWGGNAEVTIKLITENGKHEFTLNTNPGDNLSREITVDGITYQLLDVLPYPKFEEEQKTKRATILAAFK